MMELMFIMLLVFAILFIVFAIEFEHNSFWNLISIVLSAVLWFILALSVMQIERPYEIYNASSGVVETGYHTFTSPVSPFISYIFMGMGVIMMIYLFAMTYDKYINWKEER